MSYDMYLSAGLALALRRMVWAVRLFKGLALIMSGTNRRSPTRLKSSHQTGREIRRQDRQRESGAGWNKGVGSVLSPEKCIVVDR